MKSRVLQRRRLLMNSLDDEEATPLTDANLRILRILDAAESDQHQQQVSTAAQISSKPSNTKSRDRSSQRSPIQSAKFMKVGNQTESGALKYSTPIPMPCRLEAQCGTSAEGNNYTPRVKVVKQRKEKENIHRGFRFLLGMKNESVREAPVVDLTSEKNDTKKGTSNYFFSLHLSL